MMQFLPVVDGHVEMYDAA
ncbi:hypothetical protein NPIL_641351, partial [Nephila pilipes]